MNRITRTALVLTAAATLVTACNRPEQLPELGVSQPALAFEAPGGAGEPAPQTIYVVNSGHGSLPVPVAQVAYQDGAGWLAATVSGDVAPYAVAVQATSAGLDPGVYRATLTLSSAGSGASPAQVSVTLTVPDPRFTLSVQALAIDAPRGGGDPTPVAFQVVNAGRGAIPVPSIDVAYAGTATGWLTTAVAAASGGYAVTAQARAAGLPSGVHHATLTVRAAGAVVPPRTVPVTLTVPPPEVALSSHDVQLVAPAGGLDAVGIVSAGNAGGGQLAAPFGTVTYDGGAWDGMLAVSVTGTRAPYSVALVAHQSASTPSGWTRLPPGTYTATVQVAAAGAAVSDIVRVRLRVPAPTIQLSSAEVTFSEYTSCPLPAPATVTITNGGGGPLAAPAVELPAGVDGWLGVSVEPLQTLAASADAGYALRLTLKAFPPAAAGGTVDTTVVLTDPTGVASSVAVPVHFHALVPEVGTATVTPARLALSAQFGKDPAPQTLSLVTPGVCFSPTVDVEYANTAEAPWLTAAVASSPHRHDVTVVTSVAGLGWSDRRAATVHVRAAGRTWDVPVTVVPKVVAAGPLQQVIGDFAIGEMVLTPLADGRALLTGSWTGNGLSRSEIFDPSTWTWTTLAPLRELRGGHGAVQLDDGRVVVCGGMSTAPPRTLLTCEVLSGTTWSVLGSLAEVPGVTGPGNTLVTMPRGRVLVAGWGAPQVVEVATGNSTVLEGLSGGAAVKRPDGSILISGWTDRKTWLYAPALDTWAPSGDMAFEHFRPALVPLPDGRVLAVGGDVRDASVDERATQIWDPRTGAWSVAAASPTKHARSSVTLLANGKVLATIGYTPGASVPWSTDLEVFDPATGTWSVVGSFASTSRWGAAVTTLSTGMVVFAGGYQSGRVGMTTETFTW